MNQACWGVETVERRHGTVGSGDGGAAMWHGGEWSAGVTQWGAATWHGGEWRQWSGGTTRWGLECRRNAVGSGGTVGSGDGGVRRESMGIGERSAVRALAR
jgi:hypothetical protein